MTRRASGTHYDGDLGRELIDEAVSVVMEEGINAVSMRGLARRLGVSHAAPAKHVGDLRGLFTAVAAEGFRLLDDAMRCAADQHVAPLDRLRAGGAAYVRFTVTHPGHAEVMWRRNLYDTTYPPLVAASSGSFNFLADGVTAAQAEGWMPTASHDHLVAQAWAGVHGLAVLWNTEVFEAAFHAAPDDATEALVALVLHDPKRDDSLPRQKDDS